MDVLLNTISAFDPMTLLLVAAMAFVAGVVGGLSGMGASLVLAPFLVPLVGIKAVVPVMSVAMLLGQGGRIWAYRDTLDLRVAGSLLLGVVPGAMIGSTIYAYIPADAVAVLLGVFLIAVSLLRRWMERQRFRLRGVGRVVGGLGFGTLAGGMLGVGVVIFPLLMSSGLSGAALIATKAVVSIFLHVTKLTMFGAYDLLPARLVVVGLCIGVFTLPGTYVARHLFRYIPAEIHSRGVDILVFFGGLSFLWHAFEGARG